MVRIGRSRDVDSRALEEQRREMVERQLRRRGIESEGVLAAMGEVPRDRFVDPKMVEFAYEDSPLPIEEGQTISQPYIVALTLQALELKPSDRILDVGTGSGYAAAVASRIVDEVFTIERHGTLAETARQRFTDLGYDNIHVRHGDGTRGWPDHSPYDAIAVAAAGPEVPQPLREQLAPGGRIVIPVGATRAMQELLRVRKTEDGSLEEESLGGVRFVPLIGVAGWEDPEAEPASPATAVESPPSDLPSRLEASAEPFRDLEEADIDPLLERIGDARVVCLGEATHGTSEFYRFRAKITRALIQKKGFRLVTAEADWPDAARVDSWIREEGSPAPPRPAFTRFPRWMWRNEEFFRLVSWMKEWNEEREPGDQTGFFGLDLYSLHHSIEAVLEYLEEVDPEAAQVARERYGCLSPWESDPAAYGRAALSGRFDDCEEAVVSMLADLRKKEMEYAASDGHRFLDAEQNARLVRDAERYYKAMYYGARQSWNLRDQHMFDTLQALLDHHGSESRAVVWAHNSHLGDASATEMSSRGEHNLGQLCRKAFGDRAYLVGFGTHTGTVAAAHEWGGEMEVMQVQPSHGKSYEHLCHETGHPGFLLGLRSPRWPELREDLAEPRLERAIGVIYRPQTELQSHYFHASLPAQFDEYVWFDETEAVAPLAEHTGEGGAPKTFPFGV